MNFLGKCKILMGIVCMTVVMVMSVGYWRCGTGDSGSAAETGRISGEICRIDLQRTRTISAERYALQKALFTDFERRDDGTVYLLDGKNVTLYMFDSAGNLQKEFLSLGSGPGEFQPHPKLQILNHHLWVLGLRKIGKFTLDGELVEEFKLSKYYRSIRMIDDYHFVAALEALMPKGSGSHTFNKLVGLTDLRNERLVRTYIEAPDVGKLLLNLPNKRYMSVFPGPRILPDLLYAVNIKTRTIYYSHSSSYTIHTQSLDQEQATTVSFQYKPLPLAPEDKQYIAGTFRKVADPIKKQIIASLPDTLPAIHELRVLESGHLIVRRVTGVRDTVCDILDSQGRFCCSLQFNPLIDPYKLKFYGAAIAVIEETDDGNLYGEYRIENFDQIFGQ